MSKYMITDSRECLCNNCSGPQDEFKVENLFSELKTEVEKATARRNLGIADQWNLKWGNITGFIEQQEDLIKVLGNIKNYIILDYTLLIESSQIKEYLNNNTQLILKVDNKYSNCYYYDNSYIKFLFLNDGISVYSANIVSSVSRWNKDSGLFIFDEEVSSKELSEAYNSNSILICNYQEKLYYFSEYDNTTKSYIFFNNSNLSLNYLIITNFDNSLYYQTLTTTIGNLGQLITSNKSSVVSAINSIKQELNSTPSGDPNHYIYESIGAIYNNTDSDILREAPWSDLVDNEEDKYILHKSKCWYMSGIGDMTTEDIRNVFIYGQFINCLYRFMYYNKSKTLYFSGNIANVSIKELFSNSNIKSLSNFGFYFTNNESIYATFYNCLNLEAIKSLSYNSISNPIPNNCFYKCINLKYIKIIGLCSNINLSDSPLLSTKSILYMIKNALTTLSILIVLHEEVYNRVTNNSDILLALALKSNIELVIGTNTTEETTTTGTTSSTTSTTTII